MAMAAMVNECGYYDLHSHILPKMDDGSRSADESIQMLRLSREQGVVGMAATSHYYPREPVEQFLSRRQRSYEMLQEALSQVREPVPKVCLGAEVAYHSGLIYEERLQSLCMGKSRYLLLELPFSRWEPSVLRDVQALRRAQGVIPIIAHVERYWKMQDSKTMAKLLEMDVLIQMNGEAYLDAHTRRLAKKLLKGDVIQVMGSDCHNMDRRPPNLGLALHELQAGRLAERCEDILWQSEKIFMEALG
ncbi:MAG: hypothetical protein LUC47_00355 [Clostridiales bacterium]|nr:hypothetical protein [Clostridiales bacterium]